MIAPAFLQNQDIQRWLNGVVPIWTLLDFESFMALQRAPSKVNHALRLANDLTAAEVAGSAAARNAIILLRRAVDGDGLKLTATGNLSRSVVDELCQVFEWPNYDKDEAFRIHKVVNEPDFMPLYFVRGIAQMAGLLRPHRGKLIVTQLGNHVLGEDQQCALQAILFHITFWHSDLAYFGRGLLGSWPQSDIGVLLWSLSVAALNWQLPEKLTRQCTIPVNGVLNTAWDAASLAMEARILRPLLWFGLLEHKRENVTTAEHGTQHFYRKAPLFDRCLAFDVQIERNDAVRH